MNENIQVSFEDTVKFHNDLISENKLEFGSKDKKSIIPQIIVTSENEFFAKIFCENLAKETSEYYVEIKSKKARMNVEILQNFNALKSRFGL